GRGIARGHLAGVGETGLHGGSRLTVDHDDFKAGPSQIVGTGHTNDAATQDQNAHFYILIAGMAADVCCSSNDERSVKNNCQCISLYNCLYLATILGKKPFHRGVSPMRTNTQTKRELDKIDRN